MTTPSEELARIRRTYTERIQAAPHDARYSVFNPSYLYTWQQRQRDTLNLLTRFGIHTLHDKHVLEVGCGSGGVLLEYLGYGIQPKQAVGVDLMPQLVSRAKQRLPQLHFACVDGQYLPFAAHTFNIVLQYTMFSSILEASVKEKIAREMLRVLKTDGILLWYDFWWNPINRQTRGIRLSEVRSLFPNCHLTARKVTLAPPITRRLVGFSWLLCALLEKVRLLNTHYLIALRPKA
jgi:SAM-dependent methyltransferase